tara:strand:- start:234 stop:347 length:114 start_codon:yes stop_codon:yes gene_type:complete
MAGKAIKVLISGLTLSLGNLAHFNQMKGKYEKDKYKG